MCDSANSMNRAPARCLRFAVNEFLCEYRCVGWIDNLLTCFFIHCRPALRIHRYFVGLGPREVVCMPSSFLENMVQLWNALTESIGWS
jgi:hypothetical protein